MNDINTEIDNLRKKLISIKSNINNLLIEKYPDFEFNIDFSHAFNNISIDIKHSDYHWINFIKCSIFKDKFSFDHGSNSSFKEGVNSSIQLEITIKSFEVLKFIKENSENIFYIGVESFPLLIKLSSFIEEREDLLKKESLKNGIESLKKEYQQVQSLEDIQELLNNEEEVVLLFPSVNHDFEFSVKKVFLNFNPSNNLYYMYSRRSSKKHIQDLFDTDNYIFLKK